VLAVFLRRGRAAAAAASALQLSQASHSSHDDDVYRRPNIYLLTLAVDWSVERKTGRAKSGEIFAVCE